MNMWVFPGCGIYNFMIKAIVKNKNGKKNFSRHGNGELPVSIPDCKKSFTVYLNLAIEMRSYKILSTGNERQVPMETVPFFQTIIFDIAPVPGGLLSPRGVFGCRNFPYSDTSTIW